MNAHGEPCRFCGEELLDQEVAHKLLDGSCFECAITEARGGLRSLLTELWEGVRIHGLKAPTKGRDGERLIHAYCGGIVEASEALDAAYKQHDLAIQLLQRVNEKRPEIQTVALALGVLIQDPSAITGAHDDLVVTQRQLLDAISGLVEPDGAGDQALFTAVARLAQDCMTAIKMSDRWRGLAEQRNRELAAESAKVTQLRHELDCALHAVIEADPGHEGLDCCGCAGCEWVKTWLIDNGHLEADGE